MSMALDINVLFNVVISFLMAMYWYQQRQRDKIIDNMASAQLEMVKEIVAIKTMLAHLPMDAMQADITSNRHKIAQLDKALTEMAGRVSHNEKSIDGIRQTCRDLHGPRMGE